VLAGAGTPEKLVELAIVAPDYDYSIVDVRIVW
jgi:hypothetical protein